MVCCGIYAITNKTNNKKYIGLSTDILNRWKSHIQSSTEQNNNLYNSPLYCAIRKYGLESFTFEILELCDKSELIDKEIYWIDYYDSYRSGYNQTIGGDGYSTSDYDQIIEMWNEGKSIKDIREILHYDFRTIQKAISATDTYSRQEANRRGNGTKIDMYTIHGDFVKTFTSIAAAAEYVHCDRSCITRAAQCFKGNAVVRGYIFQYHGTAPPLIKNGHRSKVNQYDLSGHYIATHNSIADAARVLNLSATGIASCFHKDSKSCGGFMFRYFDGKNTEDIAPYQRKCGHRKPIAQYSLDSNLIQEYPSASSAGKATGIKPAQICACCRKEQKSAGGYKWAFL